jgi:hypothetical protein
MIHNMKKLLGTSFSFCCNKMPFLADKILLPLS